MILSLMSVAVEVPEIVPVAVLFLVPLPDTGLADCLSLRSEPNEGPEIVRVPVMMLVPLRSRRQSWL